MNDDSLSPRYYVAEATVWFLGAIVLLLRFERISPDQPIPFLDVQLADPSAFPRVLAILLLAVFIYFCIEWRSATRPQFRSFATVAWGCVALWISYPLATAGTRFEGISAFWYIGALALGFLLGQFLVLILLAATTLRTGNVARQSFLPRLSFVAEAVFVVFGLFSLLTIIASVTLWAYAAQEIQLLCLSLTAGTALFILGSNVVNLWFATDSAGNRIPFPLQTAWLRRWSDMVDYRSILSTHEPALTQLKLATDGSATQKAVRTFVEGVIYEEGEFGYRGQTLESIALEFRPKDGNKPYQSPANWTVHIRNRDRETDKVRVRVTPNDPAFSAKDLELPIRVIEEQSTAYLAGHSGEQLVDFRAMLSHALNQAILSTVIGQAPLNSIAMSGDESLLRARLESGADVNERGEFGWTALLAATAQGHPSIVKLLLAAGANPDLANVMNRTPLHFAARYGNAEICGLLLDHHAKLNMRDEYGETPLMMATRFGHGHIAHLLLTKGADPSSKNVAGQTAIDLAEQNHLGDVAKRLRDPRTASDRTTSRNT